MTRFPTYVERLQQLIEVVLMFKVLCTKGGWLSTMLMILENEYLWLGVLNAEYNIKNLINSVDDQSDERLIQEEAMSSLIQVHQVLVPVIKSDETLTVKRLLRKLALIVETNPKLGQKIELCNCNRKTMNEFVEQVDLAQENCELASKLMQKGQFKYRRFNQNPKISSDKPSIRNIKPVDKPPRPRRGRDRNFGHNFDY
ncbi:10412_t:CDS:2 [Gigaspora rosea]|nr:10412_t:CDS:2 [Gigaspora rosea]